MSFPLPSFDLKRSHNRPKLFNTSIQQFNWNELSDKDVIGSGSFGSVITAKYNGKSIVVKQLLEQHERNLRLFYKEANILHSLDDKRIVKLHAVCQSPPAMMLELVYFDFSPFGLERRVFSLKDFINFLSSEDGAMDSFSPLFIKIAEDTARSLKYLHDNNIAHRDLKPGNVLVSNQMYCEMPNKEAVREAWEKEPIICKLVDFGESRASMIQTATVCSTQTTNIDRGTPVYMAPELLSPVDTSLSLEQLKACDIWSYGMVIFMLLNPDLQFPYQVEIDKLHPTTQEMCKREVTNLLTSKQLPTFSEKFSRFQATSWLMLERIFEKCADFDPTKRPTAPILVEMFCQKEDPVCRNIPLAVSQSTSVEQHDQLVADGAIPMSNVVSGDATNSCSFLSVLIAGRILEERRDDDLPSINAALDEWQFFCENVNNLILTMPDRFNRYRDINRMYDVHEAYSILHKANIIKESYELFEEIIASSKVFTKKGRSSLSKALGKLAESSVAKVSIYTCGIYIFVIGCRSGRLFIVDTHSITPELAGNGAGLLKVFSGKDRLSQRHACAWVWKRLALSGVKSNAMQSFLIIEE